MDKFLLTLLCLFFLINSDVKSQTWEDASKRTYLTTKQLNKFNKDNKKNRERKEQHRQNILGFHLGNTVQGQDIPFKESLNVGKDLKGKDKTAFARSMLEEFAGVDTSTLANGLNELVGLQQTYYDRLQAMRDENLISAQQHSDILTQLKIQYQNGS